MFPFFFAPQGILSCFAIHLVLYKEKTEPEKRKYKAALASL